MNCYRNTICILSRVLICVLLCLLTIALIACASNERSDGPASIKDPTDAGNPTLGLPADPTETLPDSTTASDTTASSDTDAAPPATDPVIVDVTPPTVTGQDFEITQGDGVSYRKQITVEDDYDDNPTIAIDNSAVDLDTPGTYPVIFTVTDQSGNSTVLTLNLTVNKKKSESEIAVLNQAQAILDSITDSSMSKLEVAFAIYNWTSKNIRYTGTSDKSSWVVGAADGFKTRRGDCYTYFATAKALLTAADIDHIDIYRPPNAKRTLRHYWLLVNVGDGWYHFDSNNSTFFASRNANFFMVTDEEIWAWDNKYYKGEHTYDSTGLPKVSTVSIQDKIDYKSGTLIG